MTMFYGVDEYETPDPIAPFLAMETEAAEDQGGRLEFLRSAFETLARGVVLSTDESQDQDYALARLREALMYAQEAIVSEVE